MKHLTNLIAVLSVVVGGAFGVAAACVKSASRVFLALALCLPLSAPVVAYDRSQMDENADTKDLWTVLIQKKNEGDGDSVFNTLERDKRTYTTESCAEVNDVLLSDFCKDGDVESRLTTNLHFFSTGFDKDHNVVAWLLESGMAPNAIEFKRIQRANGGTLNVFMKTPLDVAYEWVGIDGFKPGACKTISILKQYGAKTYDELQGGEEEANPCDSQPAERAEPKADYTGLYANAAFAIAGTFAPSWVDAQTFAFNEGDNFITGQSLSVPLDDFTFAATRVQVNDLTDYEFSVKWDWEF